MYMIYLVDTKTTYLQSPPPELVGFPSIPTFKLEGGGGVKCFSLCVYIHHFGRFFRVCEIFSFENNCFGEIAFFLLWFCDARPQRRNFHLRQGSYTVTKLRFGARWKLVFQYKLICIESTLANSRSTMFSCISIDVQFKISDTRHGKSEQVAHA